jgi:TatD DNase family protein
MMLQWIDSHCHLDAPEFSADRLAVLQRAQEVGVGHCVMPAVQAKDFEALQIFANQVQQPYALGIHPLYVPMAQEKDLQYLENCIQTGEPGMVALGEIGLDFFVPALCEPSMREKQLFFYHAQLKLAEKYKLPVIVHVRKSADELLRGLRRFHVQGGIAHAFNGSFQQAEAFIDLGFALGFGGACTFDRALQLRRLATELPLTAIVLETDAPDIPPHWLYRTQTQRQWGVQSRNEPIELPKIGAVVAQLRGLPIEVLADATVNNAKRVLPQLSFFIKNA